MNDGMTLQALATEVERQRETRRDYLASSPGLRVSVEGGRPRIAIPDDGDMPLRQRAQRQLGTYLQVPAQFGDRVLNLDPGLWADMTTRLLAHKAGERRMVRTLDGEVRAVLSDRYHRRDNHELLSYVLPVLRNLDREVLVRSCSVTEARLYLKVVYPELTREVTAANVGHTIRAGFMVSNSEVGEGYTQIRGFCEDLVCSNGMVVARWSTRKAHLGRRLGGGDDDDPMAEIWSDETRQADDNAFFLAIRDSIKAVATEDQFDRAVEDFRQAADRQIVAPIDRTIERLADAYQLKDTEREGVLRHLIAGGDLSQWGLASAVTRLAGDLKDYDRSTDLEAMGGRLVALKEADWRQIDRN